MSVVSTHQVPAALGAVVTTKNVPRRICTYAHKLTYAYVCAYVCVHVSAYMVYMYKSAWHRVMYYDGMVTYVFL